MHGTSIIHRHATMSRASGARRIAAAALVAWFCGAASLAGATDDAQRHFRAGRDLVAANCIDCEAGTRRGMERGIREIEAALSAGYPDRIAALKLLGDAYGDMATYAGKTAEAEQFATRQTAIRGELYGLAPEDPDVLENYAETLRDDEQKIPVLRHLLERDPARNGARYALGLLLLPRDVPRGLAVVAEAIRREDNAEAVPSYAGGVIGALREQGCPLADDERWNADGQSAFDAATRGEGNPAAMARFKELFAAALDAHRCATP